MARKNYFSIFFLLLYLLFIFYITLYTRCFSLTQSCNPDLFWSYAAWVQGKPGHGREILLNIALFVPLGYFLAAVLDSSAVKRFGLLAAGLSLVISVAIAAGLISGVQLSFQFSFYIAPFLLKLINFVQSSLKNSVTFPVGPLRCLLTIKSVMWLGVASAPL